EHWRPALAFEPVTVHATAGWFPLESDAGREWRWAGGSAEFGLWNASNETIVLALRFKVASIAPGTIQLAAPNHATVDLSVGNEPASTDFVLTLPPGGTTLRLQFTGPR